MKEAGLWDEVSNLDLAKLATVVQGGELETKTAKAIMKFADPVTKTSVRLVKKKDDEE